jgi:hypothetical protein
MLCKDDNRVYNLREKSMVKLLERYLDVDKQELLDDLTKGDLAATAKKVSLIFPCFYLLYESFLTIIHKK